MAAWATPSPWSINFICCSSGTLDVSATVQPVVTNGDDSVQVRKYYFTEYFQPWLFQDDLANISLTSPTATFPKNAQVF